MSIRAKCAVLLLAFELTLCATLLFTVRYIGAYFDDAARAFTAANTGLSNISRLRTLVRNQLVQLTQLGEHPAAADECRQLGTAIDDAAGAVREEVLAALGTESWGELATLLEEQARAAAAHLGARESDRPRFVPRAHLTLDASLGHLEARMLNHANAIVDDAFVGQRRAILVLWINAVVGVLLGVGGLVLVRRWVLLPIRELERATDELGKGNLQHRAAVSSGDEFGRLAAAVNKMSGDIARLERQMIQRERLAAMGELISYVAHNIRNPLAGIQAHAEASCQELPADSSVRRNQEAIVRAIDRFQSWLRQLEHTCSPLELQSVPVDLRELVDNVATVFGPMCQRRGVHVDVRLPRPMDKVRVDPRQFEHALAAVVGNAIEASSRNGRVVIAADANGDSSHLVLAVQDEGPGIAPEEVDRIFEPTYTTKPTGHGLGLAMARKIVEMHGGQIWVESAPRGGSVFRISIPTERRVTTTDG